MRSSTLPPFRAVGRIQTGPPPESGSNPAETRASGWPLFRAYGLALMVVRSKILLMVRVGSFLLLLLLATGCATGGGSGSPSQDSRTNDTPSETTQAPQELRVKQIAANAPGQGEKRPRVVVASTAETLSRALGPEAEIPDSGSGTYVAAFWGEKPTGGYSVAVVSARRERDRVRIELSLKKPPEDALVTQSLTYPHAVAVIRDLEPAGKAFTFADSRDRELGWPVERAGNQG